jgi:ACR3 family arsenite transporter
MENVIHEERRLSFFEKYLTGWVILCVGVGIAPGKLFPQVAVALDHISIYQVSIPVMLMLVRVCLKTQNWFKIEVSHG